MPAGKKLTHSSRIAPGANLSEALLGSGIWLVLFPMIALLFRNHPEEVGQQIDGRVAEQPQVRGGRCWWGLTLHQALRTRTFWILTLGAAVFGAIHTAVFFCLIPIFQERGLSEHHAAATLTTFAICLAAMQLGRTWPAPAQARCWPG